MHLLLEDKSSVYDANDGNIYIKSERENDIFKQILPWFKIGDRQKQRAELKAYVRKVQDQEYYEIEKLLSMYMTEYMKQR
mmetsp:Transcript_9923/g.1477  ORF Transcript_9923/g.1477 Transcript_9923/m.1477 type:complete len:80 (+) Transcript_9923:1332-1571(+)